MEEERLRRLLEAVRNQQTNVDDALQEFTAILEQTEDGSRRED